MNFLVKKSIGLDIDDRSLELVELSGNATSAKLSAYGKIALEDGVIKNGLIIDSTRLKNALTQLIEGLAPKSIKVEKVVFGLPHSQLYPAMVDLLVADEKNLNDAVYQAAAINLPFESSDLLLTYKVISQQASNYKVLLIGTSRKLIKSWQDLLADLGIEVVLFDISSYALLRDAVDIDINQHNAVIDLGSLKTNFFVFHQGDLVYNHDIEIGGRFLTEIIAEKLNINFDLAEEKKLALGLNRQLYPVLAAVLEDFAKEINTALSEHEKVFGQTVTKIFLAGGGASLKGLSNYLMETVYVPNANIVLTAVKSPIATEYIEACGLALRGLDGARYSNDPYLDLTKKVSGAIVVGDFEKNEPDLVEASGLNTPTDLESTGDYINKDSLDGELILDNVERGSSKRLVFEKKLLLVIFVVGLLIIIGVIWSREKNRQQKLLGTAETVVTYSKIQTFPFKVAIATDDSIYANDKVKGRIMNDVVESANDFSEALVLSRQELSKDLLATEELWNEPLNEIIDKNKIVYPITLRWLVFDRQEVLKSALANIDQLNTAKLPYVFNDIKKTKLEKSDVLGIVYLYGQISISLNDEIAVSQTIDLGSITTSSEVMSADKLVASSSENLINEINPDNNNLATGTETGLGVVVINSTETGWLNVREGAGRNFEIVTKVYPGDSFKVLAQEDGWYQIALSNGKQGWVLASYAKKN